MKTTRELEPGLRRARLLAARKYVAGTSCWKAILGGYWDTGSIVGRHITKAS